MIKMGKFKKLRQTEKLKEPDMKKDKAKNEKIETKESHTPNNKQSKNKFNRYYNNHIKIKSRDMKNIDNIFGEEEFPQKINITAANIKNDQKMMMKSKKIRMNKSSHNLQTLKTIKALAIDDSNINIFGNNNADQKIKSLWEVLGVSLLYQKIFIKLTGTISNDKKNTFYQNEYNKLTNVFNIINNIITNINNREKNISQLQKDNNNIEENKTRDANCNLDDNKMKEIILLLIDIRKSSIEIVHNILQLRQEIGYDTVMNKYDINKIYIFPKDYLIKMNNDLDFLTNTQFNYNFNFSKGDPFFLSISNKGNNINNNNINNNSQYLLPPLEDDKMQIINNFNNIFINELLYQDLSLTNNYINNNISFDSLLKSKNKSNINKINNNSKIIKINRGLSRAKLKPKIFNKIHQGDNRNNKDKDKTQNQIPIKNDNTEIVKYSRNNINNNSNMPSNNEYVIKNMEDIDYIESPPANPFDSPEKIIENNTHNNEKSNNIKVNSALNEDDLLIFDKIIEQSIKEKNSIDKELLDNKNKRQIKINKNNFIKNEIFNNNNNNSQNIKIIAKNKNKSKTVNNNSSNISNKKADISTNNILNKTEMEAENNILKNINMEESKVKKQYQNMTIEIYKGKLSFLCDIYKKYLNQISSKLKIGFNIQPSIFKYINGIYPKILLIKSQNTKSKILGIVTLNYESNNSNISVIAKNKFNNYNKILFMSSISCINENQFSEVLLNTIDFCQEFFVFENIILQLYYHCEKGQFILYKDLETIIKNKTKFKWVNMENDGVNRKIKYKYINKNIYSNSSVNNILNVKSVFIVGYDESKNFNSLDINNLSLINDFCIIYLFIEMIGHHCFKIFDKSNCGNNYINNLINQFTFKKINQLCSDFITSQIGSASEIKSFLDDNENIFNHNDLINQIDNKIFSELLLSIAVLNISNSFKNIIKKKYNNYMYNILFDANISIFTVNSKSDDNMQLYLIHTHEDNFSIIIYELKQNENEEHFLKMFSDDNNNNNNQNDDNNENSMNLSELFKKIFSNVVQKPKVINSKILIPSFYIRKNLMRYRPSIYNDVDLDKSNEGKNYKINCINFIEEISFGVDENTKVQQNYIELDEKNEEKSLFNNEEIAINNDFIISVVNNDLIFELQIPTVSTFIVKKSSWIKC